MKRFVCVLALTLTLSGCANLLDSLHSSSSSSSEVYFDEFSDIPIPSAMKVDRKRSMVTATSEGVKTGVVTVSGDVEKLSLTTAMIHNMTQQGWTLRGMVRGNRTIEIFEKGNRFAVCCVYDQTITAAMELWVVQRLADGAMPVVSSSNFDSKPGDVSYELNEPVSSK